MAANAKKRLLEAEIEAKVEVEAMAKVEVVDLCSSDGDE